MDSVADAAQDADAVIVAVSSSAKVSGSVYSDAARAVAAAVAPGTRVIVVSSGGVDRDDKGLPLWYRRVLIPLFMDDLYSDMKVMEDIIRASELDWTIVRASYLNDGPARGSVRISDGSNPRGGWKLSRSDLAAFVAAQLSTDEWSRRLPTLAE